MVFEVYCTSISISPFPTLLCLEEVKLVGYGAASSLILPFLSETEDVPCRLMAMLLAGGDAARGR